MGLLDNVARSTEDFFNRIEVRPVRVRKADIEIVPRPLVRREGVQGTEDLGGELSGEAVDQWTIVVVKSRMAELFGANWLDTIQPHVSDWEISEDGGNWRKVRVMGQPTIQDGGYASFKIAALGFGVV